jgi:lipopolysaccharide transport system ATP-binding protein
MSRGEIRRKYDAIVAFAEVEKFLDTPVKRYSSGMYVRLAFAVAAHLEPEILVIDEVLSVGDAEFQRKCLGKMQEVAAGGRTVLLVSHNLDLIRRLCSRSLLLKAGVASQLLETEQILHTYREAHYSTGLTRWADSERYKNDYFTPNRMEVVATGVLEIDGTFHKQPSNLVVAISVESDSGVKVFLSSHRDADLNPVERRTGEMITFRVNLPIGDLNVGRYKIILSVFLHNVEYVIAPGDGPTVYLDIDSLSPGSLFYQNRRDGVLAPVLRWEVLSSQTQMNHVIHG